MGATRILPVLRGSAASAVLAMAVATQACSSAEMTDRGRPGPQAPGPQMMGPGPTGPIGSDPLAGGAPFMPTDPQAMPQQPNDPGGECGMITIEPMVSFVPGNLLVVFDRSMSMGNPFEMGGTTTRLDEAKNAINTALAPLVCPDTVDVDGMNCVDEISAALLTFPTDDGMSGTFWGAGFACTVDSVDHAEQMNWQGVTEFYKNFDPYWAARKLNMADPYLVGSYPLVFGTPISVAFARANTALMDPAVVGNKAVLFLTDGEEVGDCQGGVNPPQQAQQWFDMGIPTYVVSLASSDGFGQQFQQFNDEVARNGGTMSSINPTDSQQLSDEISKIVMNSVGSTTCEVVIQDAALTDPVAACNAGEVFVGPTKVPCDQEGKAEGFFVKNENTFEVVGSFCSQLESDMRLEAKFPCTVVVR